MTTQTEDSAARWAALVEAETRAFALFDAIEAGGLIAPGRTEAEVEDDIRDLAAREFGVTRHWHKRVVRAGANTLCTALEFPGTRTIAEDDIVFIDLGPVFEDWEADVGRAYAVGPDEAKHNLCAALPVVYEQVRAHANATPDITGAALYDYACRTAEAAGYHFGGKIAGHIVGEFPHARWPGEPDLHRIGPANPAPLSNPDHLGRPRFWILEIHLLEPGRAWGGFYERLLRG
jgi:Xaa-Pro dipeptidase